MTPRELVYAHDGYRMRDERRWFHTATLVAYLGWHKEPVSVRQIFDRITGKGDADFDSVAGTGNKEADLDEFIKHQKKPTHLPLDVVRKGA